MSEETPDIEETVEQWAQAHLQVLAAEAEEVASGFYLCAAREREKRPRSEWGRFGRRAGGLRHRVVHAALGQ